MHHRPLLSFLRRPAFTPSAPARLTLWDWVGWVGLLIVIALMGSALDAILVGLAYIRVSYGLRWSIASHYAFDILAMLPTVDTCEYSALQDSRNDHTH